MLRALSGKTQEQFGEETRVHPSLMTSIEIGKVLPGRDLQRMSRSAISPFQRPGRSCGCTRSSACPGPGARGSRRRGPPQRVGGGIVLYLLRAYTAPDDVAESRQAAQALEDRLRAEVLFERLKGLDQETRVAVVRGAEEFQTWSLCDRYLRDVYKRSVLAISRARPTSLVSPSRSRRWVRGSQACATASRADARAHGANVFKVVGDLKAAEAALEEAKQLWEAGTDSEGILDPGRLPRLRSRHYVETERRFHEALDRLDGSPCP